MRTRLSGILAMAGIVALTLPSCVSSKKYKASQAQLQQVRDDSAKLAQEVATLNGNLQSSQEQNATLQKSLDKTTADYNASNTRVQTYEGYFSKQTEAMGRVSQELKDSLAAAGITESDMEQSNGMLYVNLDENKVFKKNSTAVTKEGWLAITGLAAVLKTHDDINVGVDNGYTATGAMPAEMTNAGKWTSNDMPAKKHHYVKHRAASTATAGASAGSAADNSTASTNGAKSTTPRKHVVRHYSKEGTGAWTSNGMSSKQKSAWMLKAARVNTVAGTMLKQGMPRVAIIAQRPPTDGSANNGKIRVIVAHMPGEYPQTSGSSASASNAAAGLNK